MVYRTPKDPADKTLWLVDLKTGEGRDLLEGFDRWPEKPVWAHDASAVFFTADDDGNAPVFRVDVDSGAVMQLSGEGPLVISAPHLTAGFCTRFARRSLIRPTRSPST